MGTKAYDNFADLITFSRVSGGTALRHVGYGDELVTNGTFDTDVSGWSGVNSTLSVVDQRLRVTNTGAFGQARSSAQTVEVGKVYRIVAQLVDRPAVSNVPQVSVGTSAGGSQYLILNGGLGATSFDFSGVFVATTTTVYIGLLTPESTNYADWDNISVKEVIFDRASDPLVLFNHPANTPRIEYAADGTRKGLLIEEARTNLLLRSEEFDNAAWGKLAGGTGTAPVVTANSVVAPDGTTTADTIFFNRGAGNTVSDQSSIQQAVTVVNGLQYATSVYLKATTPSDVGRQIWLRSVDTAITTVATLTADWQRFDFVHTSNSTGARDFIFGSRGTISNDNSVSADVWGAQLEAGAFPTSYIPTAGATATRSADVASIPVSAFGYNQKAGTVVVDVDSFGITATNPMVYQINDGTTSNRLTVYGSAAQWRFVASVGGVSQASISAGAFEDLKIGSSFALNKFNHCVSGVLGTEDTSGLLPSVTTLSLGNQTGGNQLNGHIKSIAYYPRRLSNAQLQELTA